MNILEILRMVSGSLFVLFASGFLWSYVFFPGRNLDWIERVAISIGLSIAIVTLFVLVLNWLFGMEITLLNVSLAVCGLIVIPVIYISSKKLIRSMHTDNNKVK